jgi:hypothetical protein
MNKKLIIDQLISTPEIAAQEEDHTLGMIVADSNKPVQTPFLDFRYLLRKIDVLEERIRTLESLTPRDDIQHGAKT